ncbi:MAG: hypothetical protein DCC67_17900 [Planctomycetota bacterium]|nr:MAG: hypothetical protein DCC67_17900 [Planctomycetota bacterium]
MKIAIVGASGFVGSALAESLWQSDPGSVVPLIHRSGNAWQLARHGMPLRCADVLNKAELRGALEGCTHLVNCFRAGGDVMVRGLANLIDAARAAGIQRLVHISSVAVYGPRFDGGTIDEQCPKRAEPGSYGAMKEQCDRMIAKAARRGLPAVVLCPPNVSGVNSPFLLALVEHLRSGKGAIIDAELPCELVDVQNLVHAIRLALDGGPADGSRVFVTDQESRLTWRDLIEQLAEAALIDLPLPVISSAAAETVLRASRRPQASFTRAIRRLFAADVRKALRQDPMWQSAIDAVARLSKRMPARMRGRMNGAPTLARGPSANRPSYAATVLEQQLRNVRYSNARAIKELGYRPPISGEQSLSGFRHWLDRQFGWRGPMGDLVLTALAVGRDGLPPLGNSALS